MGIMTFLGNLASNTQFHKNPLWITYKPQQHKVNADQIRIILESLEKGDIFLSKHNGYKSNSLIPGFYSHVGLYVGENKIIHSIGEGVVKYDILKFLRCDSIVQLRYNNSNELKEYACKKALELYEAGTEYDFDFSKNNQSLYCSELINECYKHIFDHLFKRVKSKWIPEFIVNKIIKEKIIIPQSLYDNEPRLEKINEFRN